MRRRRGRTERSSWLAGHWTVPLGRPDPGYGAVVPQTFWDLSLYTRSESWRRVRSLRAQPPIGVLDDRRLIFAAALEQAEQQFLAAAAIGVQSRPLNLFYGLSQAGRASQQLWRPLMARLL